MPAKPAPPALRAVLSRIQSSNLRWLDLARRKQRTKWWRALRIRCKSGRSLPLGPGMSGTASVQFGTASVQAKGANAIFEGANLEFMAAPASRRRSAMRGRGGCVPRIWRGNASASLASSPRCHTSRRTKVGYPPHTVIRWQSGERPDSTQLGRQTTDRVILEADVQRQLMAAPSRPCRGGGSQ
jgi:hypothetical protein